MRIYREKDYDAMSRRAATIIAAQIVAKPDCVLGLATGSSPVGTYKNLVAWNKQGDISFKEVRSVNLDEYYGLSGDHDQSYRYFMQTNLFDHVDIVPENTNVPNGLAQDPAAEGERYEALVASLGYADLQLLGMGRNGHIGFNEPCGDHATGGSDREHHRGQRPVLRQRGRRAQAGPEHGHRHHHEGPEDPGGGQRRR